MKYLLTLLVLASYLMQPAFADDKDKFNKVGCSYGLKSLKGKVKVVTGFADIKVQVVTSFPDIKVQLVESFPDNCGQWQMVESFPDFTIQFVESFPDLKIQYVTSFPGVQ